MTDPKPSERAIPDVPRQSQASPGATGPHHAGVQRNGRP